jgi:hypothetical protein
LSEAARDEKFNVARKTANAIRPAWSVLDSASGRPVGRRDGTAVENSVKSEAAGMPAPAATGAS